MSIFSTTSKTDEAERSALVEKIQAIGPQSSELERKSEATRSALAAKDRALGIAALDADLTGNSEPYKALLAEVDQLHDEAMRHALSRKALAEQEDQARKRLDVLSRADQVKRTKHVTDQRFKNAVEMVGHLEGYAKCYVKQFEINARLAIAFPGPVPSGAFVDSNEAVAAVSDELFRIHPVHPLVTSKAPLLPGARYHLVDAANIKSLLDRIDEANKHLLALVAAGPSLQKPAPLPAADADTPQEQTPTGPSYDARSYVPPRRSLNAGGSNA